MQTQIEITKPDILKLLDAVDERLSKCRQALSNEGIDSMELRVAILDCRIPLQILAEDVCGEPRNDLF